MVFDTILRTQAFVATKSFWMADIMVIDGLIFARLLDLSLPAGCEAIQAWYAEMQKRPSVRAG